MDGNVLGPALLTGERDKEMFCPMLIYSVIFVYNIVHRTGNAVYDIVMRDCKQYPLSIYLYRIRDKPTNI